MKLIPENKGRAAVLLVILVLAAAVVAAMNLGRGDRPAPVDPAIQERAAAISASVKSPEPVPDLPVDKRPPRGPAKK
jgi:hypothetical protein